MNKTDQVEQRVPTCPQCGAPMQLRKAGKGRFAGQAFWGCSQYPKCKAVVPASGNENEGHADTSWVFLDPIRLPASPACLCTDAVYLECGAGPRRIVEQCVLTDVPPDLVRALSQWQLDMPKRPAKLLSCPTWITVAEKILKKGRLTCLSPSLEENLSRAIGVSCGSEEPLNDVLVQASYMGRPTPHWASGFDSLEEELFVNRYLPSVCGPDAAAWMMRQVQLLVGKATQNTPLSSRVDFTMCIPNGPKLVIEIDGVQHRQTIVADRQRDTMLRSLGFDILRIAADEVRRGNGPQASVLRSLLCGAAASVVPTDTARFIYVCRRAHQLQLALWYFLRFCGMENPSTKDWKVAVLWDKAAESWDTTTIVDHILDDFNELLSDVASLYGAESPHFHNADQSTADLVVDFTAHYAEPPDRRIFVRDIFLPFTIATDLTATGGPADVPHPDRQVCERLLKRVYGFARFREGQYESLVRALKGQDAVVLLPTGAGKSAIFQMAGLLRPGIALVVAPILSLIEDQLYNLRRIGIDRACQVTSLLDAEDRHRVVEVLSSGEYLFCYIAPERLQDESFRSALRALSQYTCISVAAIDEAHCVSEWGHDFRPAYLNIARIIKEYCRTGNKRPPLLALTGTASRSVLRDVQRELEILEYDAVITPRTFDRPELRFRTVPCRPREKFATLCGILQGIPLEFGLSASVFYQPRSQYTCSGLVFCPWVNGEYGITTVEQKIRRTLHLVTDIYSGKPPHRWQETQWRHQRRLVALKFKRDQIPVLVCTKAFGMGIDKPNIRYTVHYSLPPSVEAFYQEAGRAGRDGQQSLCYLIFSNDNPARAKRLLDPSLPADQLYHEVQAIPAEARDDVVNMLWFHTQSFSGSDSDYQAICDLLDNIGDIEARRSLQVTYTDSDRVKREQALHRLVCMGVISDYTIDHASRTFSVQVAGASREAIIRSIEGYVSNYQVGQGRAVRKRLEKLRPLQLTDFVRAAARELVDFVYGVIERSRRQALAEMLAICEESHDEDQFRRRLLQYLGTTEYSDSIAEMTRAVDGGLRRIVALIQRINSRVDAARVRGEVGRALEAYPDHPGLRVLRGLAEALCDTPNEDTIARNILAGVRFARERYGLDDKVILRRVFVAASFCAHQRPQLAHIIATALLRAFKSRIGVARIILQSFPQEGLLPAVTVLLRRAKHSVEKVLGA
ncbi:MAG: hypothetical protein KatS3mg110_3220 [Pirellulaceae bacterium]|nr:MAG: hypothetical protein KatS3mg110_3220 [Pirellulaceae bacterium]